MAMLKLFQLPDTKASLIHAFTLLTKHPPSSIPFTLGKSLKDISFIAEKFDQYCQINIGWIGESVPEQIKEVINSDSEGNIYTLSVTMYRFITEYDLSVVDDMAMSFRLFAKAVLSGLDKFNDNERQQIEFATKQMPVAVIKQIVNSVEFGNIRNLSEVADRVEKTIKGWEGTLLKAETDTIRLSDSLEKHTKEFNFVGLREGFSDLASTIEVELRGARHLMGIFGCAAMLPSAFDLWLVFGGRIDVMKFTSSALILLGIGTISITLLILYYFRIALRKADSCNVQLTQLRLRMSLCRFIQNYSDYAKEMKDKNPDSLAKFENLIFSGIVSSEEKLPSTFDGFEQLASLAKSIKGG